MKTNHKTSKDALNEDCSNLDNKTSNENNSTLLMGIKPVLEFLNSEFATQVDALFIKKGLRNGDTTLILDLCRALGIRFSLVDTVVLDKMCVVQQGAKSNDKHQIQHQGVIARLGARPKASLEELFNSMQVAPLPLILALDQVQDPGNVGTLARTLYALGGVGLLLPKHNSAYLGHAAQRASMGALDSLPVVSVTNLGHALDEAEERGFNIIGTGLMPNLGTANLNAFKDILPLPAILVLGNEGKGLRPGVLKRCTHMVHIPMLRKFDSLNVAQAGALLMGIISKQHITS